MQGHKIQFKDTPRQNNIPKDLTKVSHVQPRNQLAETVIEMSEEVSPPTRALEQDDHPYTGGSTQSRFERTTFRQGVKPKHRWSSPQICTFSPHGRSLVRNDTRSANYPLRTNSKISSIIASRLRSTSLNSRLPVRGVSHQMDGYHTLSSSQSSLSTSCESLMAPSHTAAVLTRSGYRRASKNYGSVSTANHLGAIQRDLYVRNEEPIYVNASRPDNVYLGRLHIAIGYESDKSNFVVTIIKAENVTRLEQGGFAAPFVRVILLPEIDLTKRQTIRIAIDCDELNASYNQRFKFPVSYEELKLKTLLLQVMDDEDMSSNGVIGEISLELCEFEFDAVNFRTDIIKVKKPSFVVQEIKIGVKYLPRAERLFVGIVQARNLLSLKDTDDLDVFVEIYLIVNGKQLNKKRTSTQRATRTPHWNEGMSFNLPYTDRNNAVMEFYVYDKKGGHRLLGTCSLGPKDLGTDLNDRQCVRKYANNWHRIN